MNGSSMRRRDAVTAAADLVGTVMQPIAAGSEFPHLSNQRSY
jgi:hypothetical protein